jgi:hypothetical protein
MDQRYEYERTMVVFKHFIIFSDDFHIHGSLTELGSTECE